jgi:hypothetical protein
LVVEGGGMRGCVSGGALQASPAVQQHTVSRTNDQ